MKAKKKKNKRHKAIMDSNLMFYRHVNKRIFLFVSHFSTEVIFPWFPSVSQFNYGRQSDPVVNLYDHSRPPIVYSLVIIIKT